MSESQFNLLRVMMVEWQEVLEDAHKFITLITYSPGMT
jgi:hypothetical protein